MLMLSLFALLSKPSYGYREEDTNFKRFRFWRNPTIEGTVVLPPGQYDSNFCVREFEGNQETPRYDSGGFYVQGGDGSSIFVCPTQNELVNDIKYGDYVKVTGSVTTDPFTILTMYANKIKKGQKTRNEIIDRKYNFKEYLESDFGDLVEIQGFVTSVETEKEFGTVFRMMDCDGTEIKGFFVGSIDPDVNMMLSEFFKVCTDTSPANCKPSYFKIVGFVEIFWPICFDNENAVEFLPRFVEEVEEINPPPCSGLYTVPY